MSINLEPAPPSFGLHLRRRSYGTSTESVQDPPGRLSMADRPICRSHHSYSTRVPAATLRTDLGHAPPFRTWGPVHGDGKQGWHPRIPAPRLGLQALAWKHQEEPLHCPGDTCRHMLCAGEERESSEMISFSAPRRGGCWLLVSAQGISKFPVRHPPLPSGEAPVCESQMARGLLPWSFRWCLGQCGRWKIPCVSEDVAAVTLFPCHAAS